MENSSSKGNALKIALGIAVVLFLGLGFYTSKVIKDNKKHEAELVKEKEQVMADLSNMAKQYDIAISENEVANEKLVEARDRIQQLMDSLKISQNSVNSLWRYKQKFLALEDEMDKLLAENDRLSLENELLAATLDSTQVQLAERTIFTDSLLVQNTELATIVKGAAILQPVNLKGFGVIERNSGKLIPTERAGRSDKLRVCFTVAKNNLISSGDQSLYVQVINPLNNTLGVNEQIEFDDKILNYSLISTFNYENKNLDVCEFVTSNDGKFEKGTYKVNVFHGKNLVAATEFILQ
ncbi:DUF3450 domain-containing protein [Paucihalobacter ruber]|uniref:DUF3450 domain-containing protein n=1 Tax=Paucihalobacter ruber TaxID=2567861 RepID=A0A506PFX4_9FLAO|nr:DUF3450 domain-containing protein [Paucihalobacter ruber]TPV32408.1 DUF3450 domain-containing protein [Paucihalobacter ruber]